MKANARDCSLWRVSVTAISSSLVVLRRGWLTCRVRAGGSTRTRPVASSARQAARSPPRRSSRTCWRPAASSSPTASRSRACTRVRECLLHDRRACFDTLICYPLVSHALIGAQAARSACRQRVPSTAQQRFQAAARTPLYVTHSRRLAAPEQHQPRQACSAVAAAFALGCSAACGRAARQARPAAPALPAVWSLTRLRLLGTLAETTRRAAVQRASPPSVHASRALRA